MTGVVLGVDGGNTKTLAIAVRPDGTVAGWGRAGCGDIHGARMVTGRDDEALALAEVERAATAALRAAGAAGADVRAAALSMAGADWPEDVELLRTDVQARLGLADAPLVVNDSIGLLRAGTTDGVGVAIAVGTYAAVGGRAPDGGTFNHGFFPDPLGARALGADAVRAVRRAALGLDPPTALTDPTLDHFGVADADALAHLLFRRGGPGPTAAAALAAVVLDLADAGDAVAAALVDLQVTRLAEAATTCAARLGLSAGHPVVLAGGVLRHASARIEAGLRAALPSAGLTRARHEPVLGAAMLALDRAGMPVDEQRLAATSPSAAFFPGTEG